VDAEPDRAALERCGARLLPWSSPLYPPRLRQLVDAPPVLLVQGDAAAL
jgi:DNA processing protein